MQEPFNVCMLVLRLSLGIFSCIVFIFNILINVINVDIHLIKSNLHFVLSEITKDVVQIMSTIQFQIDVRVSVENEN